jgi:hypothetical protein
MFSITPNRGGLVCVLENIRTTPKVYLCVIKIVKPSTFYIPGPTILPENCFIKMQVRKKLKRRCNNAWYSACHKDSFHHFII